MAAISMRDQRRRNVSEKLQIGVNAVNDSRDS